MRTSAVRGRRFALTSLALAAVLLIAAGGTPIHTPAAGSGALSISPGSFDFGNKQINTVPLSVGFDVTNNGPDRTGTLDLGFGPRFDPDQFTFFDYSCRPTLGPGETCRVLVGFYPHSAGPKQAEVVAKTDNPADGRAVTTVSGTGVLGKGSLQVTKALDDPDHLVGSDYTFRVAVDCDRPTVDTTLTFGATGGTKSVPNIPEGTQCNVTETGTAFASEVHYDPGQTVTIVADAAVTVRITNVYVVALGSPGPPTNLPTTTRPAGTPPPTASVPAAATPPQPIDAHPRFTG